MTQISNGKMGADVIDTKRKPEDDPTSPLWVKQSDPQWRDELRERMRDEHDSGLDGVVEEDQDEPLYED